MYITSLCTLLENPKLLAETLDSLAQIMYRTDSIIDKAINLEELVIEDSIHHCCELLQELVIEGSIHHCCELL